MNVNVSQLDVFCNRWLRKAKMHGGKYSSTVRQRRTGETQTARGLAHSFDRFTSLFVVYNRVYTEVGKLLIAEERIPPSRRGRYAPLPDRRTATQYVVTFYGSAELRAEMQADEPCRSAVDTLVDLIESNHFYLHENYETGVPDLDRDRRLARMAAQYDPKSILELIYQARCNLFHGTKAFENRQKILLDNMSTIVEFVTYRVLMQLRRRLREAHGFHL